jgi:hypothetical protein
MKTDKGKIPRWGVVGFRGWWRVLKRGGECARRSHIWPISCYFKALAGSSLDSSGMTGGFPSIAANDFIEQLFG